MEHLPHPKTGPMIDTPYALHPLIGLAGCTLATFLPFIQSVNIVLQCAATAVGLAIGVLSLYRMIFRKDSSQSRSNS